MLVTWARIAGWGRGRWEMVVIVLAGSGEGPT